MKLVCRLKSDAKRKQQRRQDFRHNLVKVCCESPPVAKDLNTFNRGTTRGSGSPRTFAYDHQDCRKSIYNR